MKLIVGNWKMNQTLVEVKNFFETMKSAQRRHEAWIAPQALHIPLSLSLAPASVKIGAQNCSDKKAGAFTGENSPISLKELGADFVLVGHSERRQYHGETDADVATKAQRALAAGITPIVCVGETLAEREAGQTQAVVKRQLAAVIHTNGHCISEIVVAYEPVWAIGTGQTATPEQAQEVHALLRAQLAAATAHPERIALLYGGSMNAANAASLLAQHDIDGGLIGGASLQATDFLTIVAAASH